jgi:hypothetical protein
MSLVGWLANWPRHSFALCDLLLPVVALQESLDEPAGGLAVGSEKGRDAEVPSGRDGKHGSKGGARTSWGAMPAARHVTRVAHGATRAASR